MVDTDNQDFYEYQDKLICEGCFQSLPVREQNRILYPDVAKIVDECREHLSLKKVSINTNPEPHEFNHESNIYKMVPPFKVGAVE